MWLHDTDQARAAGKSGSAEAIKTYLQTIIGEGQYREDLAEAFVSAGREALAFLEREGAVKYSLRPLSPDYSTRIDPRRRRRARAGGGGV